jgi:hypothetical protein
MFKYLENPNTYEKRLLDIKCTIFSLSLSLYGSSSKRSPDSAVGIANGQLRGRSSSPGMVKNFLHAVNTCSGAHPASYRVGTVVPFPGGNSAGARS